MATLRPEPLRGPLDAGGRHVYVGPSAWGDGWDVGFGTYQNSSSIRVGTFHLRALHHLLGRVLALTPEEVMALPVGSVIRDAQSHVLERYTEGWRNGWREPVEAVDSIQFPVHVLFVPQEY